ncbi:hypothetical protein QN372_19160 [Undibacterium sp. RTI2.1]|uniref:hypothetical protein n=1 Tax=unclassified Undibacterium TaxID=2630295 RepID=UPI002AB48C08|nr:MULTISPECIES: hypothetical protein [unclassified Undibacterium]MDY7538106.1 hypothetical protein [Undibacterium sp. 5I1]MEB0032872.1 hypothetical protein [Undibacterium sp. RTI2.1]MEB0118696.1 hypothetical protein [Undibacterium sp. RTI2.2]MEB0232574.1 hypothetical protein [Undibacterium sp. 10I3]MEB0259607.1 hypothetical protein [Undibacterium sp. 5I1]
MHYRLICKNEKDEPTKTVEAGDDYLAAVNKGAGLRHELNAPYQIDLVSVTHDGQEHKLAQLGGFTSL